MPAGLYASRRPGAALQRARGAAKRGSVLLRSVETPAAGVGVAAAVRRAVAHHLDIAGVRLELGASVGIACFPEHGEDVDVLMQRADVAMYQAKEGRTGVERYVRELDGNSVQRLALAGDLRGGLERDEFVLHYQPKVDLRTAGAADPSLAFTSSAWRSRSTTSEPATPRWTTSSAFPSGRSRSTARSSPR
jgi:predicted signal transduction protein with EAL and GGDEF domain